MRNLNDNMIIDILKLLYRIDDIKKERSSYIINGEKVEVDSMNVKDSFERLQKSLLKHSKNSKMKEVDFDEIVNFIKP